MSFDIYEIVSEANDEEIASLSDDDKVESNLSSGELRQAILDRFRQELKTEDVYFVNLSLEPFGLDFEPDLAETQEGQNSILTDVENFLYDAEDEVFHNTVWEFHNEAVCVKSNDE